MKNRLFRCVPLLTVLLLIPTPGRAVDKKGDEAAKRPPLDLRVDSAPVDRNAPPPYSYAPIVKRTAASVVYVYSSKTVSGRTLAPFLDDPMFRQFFGRRGQQLPEQIPDQVRQGLGSGIVVSANGYILTNNHVVEGADDVKVAIGESSRRYDATVVGTDALADIAVLRIDAKGLVPATLGDSDQLQIGDPVIAIGNPFGVGQSVSGGIVSALGRGPGIEAVEDFIQTDAAINPGNSGGALLDTAGRVVGINTAIMSGGSRGFAGVGFAIPINLARMVVEQIASTGQVNRGFLGVMPQSLTPELADHFKTDEGALIAEVTPDSPAEKAGIQAGDVITRVNGNKVTSARRLLLVVGQFAPGTEVTVDCLREGKTRTVKVTLAKRPEREGAGGSREAGGGGGKDVGVLNGVGVGDLTPELRQQMQIPARIQGAIITNVDPTSPSGKQGLQEGDVILELDRQPVHNAEEAVRRSEEIKGPKVMVRLWRDGRSQFVIVDESEGKGAEKSKDER
ncbi:MAG TPA: Do family serine endopeptidase [Lacunisphaera sp.]|nr:Do family serine endopeptidase [Lacunisphaera sp.]